jgi:hypothetical protein
MRLRTDPCAGVGTNPRHWNRQTRFVQKMTPFRIIYDGTLYKPCWWRLRRFVGRAGTTMKSNAPRYSARAIALGLFTCMAVIGTSPASADTTYYYVGNPYTTNSDPTNFGTNMTGSVTFDFDTSGVTGVFYLSQGHITDLQLTSGIYSVDATNFTFNLPILFPPYFMPGAENFGGEVSSRSPLALHHSITSSARASTVPGISMRSDLAVLRLITRSNFVGSITGNSAGFSPFKIRPA